MTQIKLGDSIQLPFPCKNGRELLWFKVTNANGNQYAGTLINEPEKVKAVKWGDAVKFTEFMVLNHISK